MRQDNFAAFLFVGLAGGLPSIVFFQRRFSELLDLFVALQAQKDFAVRTGVSHFSRDHRTTATVRNASIWRSVASQYRSQKQHKYDAAGPILLDFS